MPVPQYIIDALFEKEDCPRAAPIVDPRGYIRDMQPQMVELSPIEQRLVSRYRVGWINMFGEHSTASTDPMDKPAHFPGAQIDRRDFWNLMETKDHESGWEMLAHERVVMSILADLFRDGFLARRFIVDDVSIGFEALFNDLTVSLKRALQGTDFHQLIFWLDGKPESSESTVADSDDDNE